ncbi:hypothetical protein [Marinifilum caeruleilacunae]|uniref:hypothetical protein n=1 Tax=Marinifilum caeruleilacunae TaxID=2499076 RepID=UPI001491A0F6|nr:hypothetical protein [Marinifilum caeruleilacunae]
MDALDKSVKLAEIPGLSKLSGVLDRKSKRIVEKQTEKVENAINDFVDDKIAE